MKRTDLQVKRFNAWAKRTGYEFGTKRAGGSRISQEAVAHMRHKPYSTMKMSGTGDEENGN